MRCAPADTTQFRIEVEDNGIGINSEDIARLFVEFQQLDATTRSETRLLLSDILARCLDVIGFSRGAIFLADSKNRLGLSAHIGFSAEAAHSLPTFFGYEDFLCNAMLETEPVTLSFPVGRQESFERAADPTDDSVIVCSLWSGGICSTWIIFKKSKTRWDTATVICCCAKWRAG